MSEHSEFLQFLDDYLADARDSFQETDGALLALEREPGRTELLDLLFRNAHTLKSSSAMLEFGEISQLAHATEDLLARLRTRAQVVTPAVIAILFDAFDSLKLMVRERAGSKGRSGTDWGQKIAALRERLSEETDGTEAPVSAEAKGETESQAVPKIEKIETVRVSTRLLDSLFNLIGELLITKRQIDTLLPEAGKALRTALGAMDRLIGELQEDVSEARLVKADEILRRFPRMMRDLAKEQGKDVELVMQGQEIDLDKTVLDAIGEPLMHLLRNAVDHGVERAEVRQQQNKPPAGTVRLTVRRTESHIEFAVEDDGAGIVIERVKEAFVKKGLIEPGVAQALSREEVLAMIFRPGFTSAERVTGVSGRGVGLDIVKTAVERLGGTVAVETKEGRGSRFGIRLPLSTALIQTMMVNAGIHIFAIPSDIVHETLQISRQKIREMGQERVLVYHNEPVPFYMLHQLLDLPGSQGQQSLVVLILAHRERIVGLGVDSLEYQAKTIVKPFDPIAQHFKGFSGGTVLGDGRVVLLLDVPALLDQQPPGRRAVGTTQSTQPA